MSTNTTEFLNNIFISDNKPDVQAIGFTILFVVISSYLVYTKLVAKSSTNQKGKQQSKQSKLYDKSKEYQPLNPTPLTDFKWDAEPPLKSYPFKNAEYKLTMGIRTLDPQDWLLVEPTYKSRIEAKQKSSLIVILIIRLIKILGHLLCLLPQKLPQPSLNFMKLL